MAAGHPQNVNMFLSFSEVLEGILGVKGVITFLGRLKEAHLRFLELQNLKILERLSLTFMANGKRQK